jgi:hypothetical protein
MKGFPDLPPLWLILFLGLNWAFAQVLPGLAVSGAMGVASWALIVAGLSLIVWAAVWFWRRKTTIEPHHDPQALIVEGPFRVSRNPIYLGLLIILLGSVVGRGQPFGLVLVAVCGPRRGAIACGFWRGGGGLSSSNTALDMTDALKGLIGLRLWGCLCTSIKVGRK